MAHCPVIKECTFLTDETFLQMHGLIQRFQQSYCRENFAGCARYIVASTLSESAVPPMMIPTQIEWARQIINEAANSRSVKKT